MLKINHSLFVGIVVSLFCSNINAMDYGKSNFNVIDDDLNVSFLSSDYLWANKLEDNSNYKLKGNNPRIIRYSTKCRGKNNPYNNHVFLEVIELSKTPKNKIKGKTYLRLEV